MNDYQHGEESKNKYVLHDVRMGRVVVAEHLAVCRRCQDSAVATCDDVVVASRMRVC